MAGFLPGQPRIVKPSKEHTATVIILHGLGDSDQTLSTISEGASFLGHVKWVFPAGPIRPVTLQGGVEMPGWFDLYRVEDLLQAEVDHEGVNASVRYLDSLVEAEAKEVPASRIVVGGFSQGGHVAIKLALSAKHCLPGCVMLSSWTEAIPGKVPQHATDCKFFIGHGSDDPLLPVALPKATVSLLEDKGCKKVTLRVYPGMGHCTSRQELDDVKDFLQTIIPDVGDQSAPAITAWMK